jgi:GT2 family glycosyltransferase
LKESDRVNAALQRLGGAAVSITVRRLSNDESIYLKLGFQRVSRHPQVVFRSPRIVSPRKAIFYGWIPKATVALRLCDVEGQPLNTTNRHSIRIRRVTIAELLLRGAFKNPQKAFGILRLLISGNMKGVVHRFTRLTDELNSPSYANWLRLQTRPDEPARVHIPSIKPIVLISLEPATIKEHRLSRASLSAQTWKFHREVSECDLNNFAEDETESLYLWMRLPAGATLSTNALEALIEPFSSPDVVAVYSDEDRVNRAGLRFSPFFKPAFNRPLVHSTWLPVDGSLLRLSSLPVGMDVSTLSTSEIILLAAARKKNSVLHIPRVLLHQARKRERSPGGKKPIVSPSGPSITVIIPTRDRVDLLKICLDGLQEKTNGVVLDIIIVDNASEEQSSLDFLRKIETEESAKVIRMPGAFNFSRACNIGVTAARFERILLLNNDIEPIVDDWLLQMSQELDDTSVGAVGALLFFPDGFVQHAGVITGSGSVARHAMHFIHPNSGEDSGLLGERREVSAVTAACLLTTKSLWEEVGGMDENNLAVAFNDVDYCLKLRHLGRKVIWTPHAKLWHRESVSRGPDNTEEKIRRFAHEELTMHQRWKNQLHKDPFHNPNLSLVAEENVLETFPRDLSARGPDVP